MLRWKSDLLVVLGAWESHVQGEAAGQNEFLSRKHALHAEVGEACQWMIPERLGGHSTIENVCVTHRWCYEKYRLTYGYDTLPSNPERFLTPQERIVDGRVVWTQGHASKNGRMA
jgi:hypothetical protein